MMKKLTINKFLFFSNDNDFHEDVFSNIIVGTRLSVYWEEDNQSYPCKVDSFNNFSDLKYDDGQEEIVDLKKENFKILTQKNNKCKNNKIIIKEKEIKYKLSRNNNDGKFIPGTRGRFKRNPRKKR